MLSNFSLRLMLAAALLARPAFALADAAAPSAKAASEQEIDEAWTACQSHQIGPFVERRWQPGFESCADIKRSWDDTRPAREMRRQAEEESAHKALIDDIAKRLGKH